MFHSFGEHGSAKRWGNHSTWFCGGRYGCGHQGNNSHADRCARCGLHWRQCFKVTWEYGSGADSDGGGGGGRRNRRGRGQGEGKGGKGKVLEFREDSPAPDLAPQGGRAGMAHGPPPVQHKPAAAAATPRQEPPKAVAFAPALGAPAQPGGDKDKQAGAYAGAAAVVDVAKLADVHKAMLAAFGEKDSRVRSAAADLDQARTAQRQSKPETTQLHNMAKKLRQAEIKRDQADAACAGAEHQMLLAYDDLQARRHDLDGARQAYVDAKQEQLALASRIAPAPAPQAFFVQGDGEFDFRAILGLDADAPEPSEADRAVLLEFGRMASRLREQLAASVPPPAAGGGGKGVGGAAAPMVNVSSEDEDEGMGVDAPGGGAASSGAAGGSRGPAATASVTPTQATVSPVPPATLAADGAQFARRQQEDAAAAKEALEEAQLEARAAAVARAQAEAKELRQAQQHRMREAGNQGKDALERLQDQERAAALAAADAAGVGKAPDMPKLQVPAHLQPAPLPPESEVKVELYAASQETLAYGGAAGVVSQHTEAIEADERRRKAAEADLAGAASARGRARDNTRSPHRKLTLLLDKDPSCP